jgi:hypothetical protein
MTTSQIIAQQRHIDLTTGAVTEGATIATAVFRIEVTTKGETGYLSSETGADLRTLWGLTFDKARTASYRTRERAERRAAKIAGRFDRVQVVEEQA